MHADIRDAELRQVAISRTETMAADQETTDAYAQVPESLLDATRHNRIRFVVLNSDGVNAIDAKVMGRIKDADGTWSEWQDDPDANMTVNALAALASTLLYTDNVGFDQYAVYVKADTPASQGDANVIGKSFFLNT